MSALEAEGFTFVALSDLRTFPTFGSRLADARARRLGLGNRRTAHLLVEGKVDMRWLAAAGGPTPPLTLQWPVDRAVVARGFGSGEDGYHLAVDVAGVRGSDVRSVADGLVAYAGAEMPGYGNTVIVIHPGGLVSFYAHNERNIARAGQLVQRGEVIAALGDSGLARGPHVHFELLWNEMSCDPAPLFRPLPMRGGGNMFGKKTKQSQGTTLIGEGSEFEGTLRVSDGLQVDETAMARSRSKGGLSVGPSGILRRDIREWRTTSSTSALTLNRACIWRPAVHPRSLWCSTIGSTTGRWVAPASRSAVQILSMYVSMRLGIHRSTRL